MTKNKTAWRKVKLGDFVEVNPAIKLQRGKEYPFLDMADVQPFSRTIKWQKNKVFKGSGARFKNGDTLFARITPCLENGKITQALNLDKPGFGSTEFYVLRGREGVSDNDFVYYLSRTYRIRKLAEQSMIGTSGRQRVERTAFENIEIEIPSDLNDQKRIASILSSFDDKIELNNKISAALEQTAQAIFKEWFVKNKKLKAKSEKLGNLVKIISGHPFSSKLYTRKQNDTFSVVTIKNVQDGNFITSCDSFIKENKVPENINLECRIHDGNILLSLTGNVGRVCFVYGGNYLLNQRVAKIVPKEEKNRAYCYFLFRQSFIQNRLINMAKGSAQPNLSPVETGEIEISMPDQKILDKFNKFAEPIYNRLVKNKVENQKLAALRDSLLPKLMTGEIEV